MPPLLLDSHVVVWAMTDDPRLGTETKLILTASELWVSVVSPWELFIKESLGKIELPQSFLGEVTALGMSWLGVESTDGYNAAHLDLHHRDPFDRMMIAQALRINATLVSADTMFEQYPVKLHNAHD